MDTIKGEVSGILNPATFELHVTQVGNRNEHRYAAYERVAIIDIDEPELAGLQTTEQLGQALLGRRLRCFIIGRRADGILEAQIQTF